MRKNAKMKNRRKKKEKKEKIEFEEDKDFNEDYIFSEYDKELDEFLLDSYGEFWNEDEFNLLR